MERHLQLSIGAALKTSTHVAPAQAPASPPTETISLVLPGLMSIL